MEGEERQREAFFSFPCPRKCLASPEFQLAPVQASQSQPAVLVGAVQDGKGKAPAHAGPRGFEADACQFVSSLVSSISQPEQMGRRADWLSETELN